MGRFGIGEILLILAIALLFFGPSQLPKLGASLGAALKGLKKGISGEEEKPLPPPPPPGA